MEKTAVDGKGNRVGSVCLFLGLVVIIFAGGLLFKYSHNFSNKPLTVVSYGGEWQDVLRSAIFEPFMSETGNKLVEDKYDGDYSVMASHSFSRMPNNIPEWDVVDAEANMLLKGKGEGILEPIDYSIVTLKGLNAAAKNKYGVGNVAWSSILAYNSDAFGDNPPTDWEDFFDTRNFPGARALRKDPRRTLEIALLGDGVSPLELYPLDVDRAFIKLEKLLHDLSKSGFKMVWWSDFAEPPRLLSSGEVSMSSAANGRIAAALKENKSIPVSYSWKGGIMNLDFWVVMKNSPNRKKAMEFINIACSPEAQAEVALKFFYGPSNEDAFKLISEDVQKMLPNYPDNLKKQIFFDSEWWFWYGEDIQKRWDGWIKKHSEVVK